MRRITQQLVVLGACLVFILSLTQVLDAQWKRRPRAAGVSFLSEMERTIYHLTNQVRRRFGLPTLNWETSLRDLARAHSADMLLRNYFSHDNPDGQTPHDRILAGYRFPLSMSGENIWGGTGHDPGDAGRLARIIVDSWMSSAGHRKNLLNPDFTDIGVGVATRGKEIKATQVFVRTRQRR
jgi:uncharacterized protein YkwD